MFFARARPAPWAFALAAPARNHQAAVSPPGRAIAGTEMRAGAWAGATLPAGAGACGLEAHPASITAIAIPTPVARIPQLPKNKGQVSPMARSGTGAYFSEQAAILGFMLYLASKSPRRRELLAQLGVDHGVLEVEVPEERQPGEPPADYVSRVAREKAGAGLLRVVAVPGACVLGSDTEVVLGDKVYGKPVDAADAAAMLRELSGRRHRVLTAVWVLDAGREEHLLSETAVDFCELSEHDIATYIASEEWQGKAGAYGIQGRAGAFVTRIEGSYTGVMGLPAHETWKLLRRFAVG